MPANQSSCTITRVDEMKLNDMNECGEMVEWNLWHGKMGETPRKTYSDSAHQETHVEWPRRELRIPSVWGERLTACTNKVLIHQMFHNYTWHLIILSALLFLEAIQYAWWCVYVPWLISDCLHTIYNLFLRSTEALSINYISFQKLNSYGYVGLGVSNKIFLNMWNIPAILF